MIRPEELIVDNFAGGGGASTAIEQALGRPVDIAINHDPEAIAMHAANHPHTRHLCENVWAVDPVAVCEGRPVGLAWFSPDCKHFSKAKGGKPVAKKIRGLAWVALKWAELVRPRVISLENVEEFQTWGPLLEDNRPCPKRKGETFRRWVARLRNLGYVVDWRELKAHEFGAPTIRKRLFIVARCDGREIVWPEPTHGPGLLPFRTAAECIDWSIPCPSIFLTKEEGRAIGVNRPLAEATMRRIARGVKRYVLDAKRPFIVRCAHGEAGPNSKRWGKGEHGVDEPLPTLTASRDFALATPFLAGLGGRMGQSPERGVSDPYHTITAKADTALVAAHLTKYYGAKRDGDLRAGSPDEPLATQPTENRHAVVAAFLAKHFGGHETPGASLHKPADTITAQDHHALVASHMLKMRGTNIGSATDEPLHTLSAGGTHHAEVRAFLMKYYGAGGDENLEEPLHTIPTRDRFGLVMVEGEPHVIVDIGMRMLTPRELFRAQGFPDSYIIEYGIDPEPGRKIPLSKTAQVRMCGNSVSPYPGAALIRAQFAPRASEAAA